MINIINKVKNLIKKATQTLPVDDSDNYPTAQITFLGQTQTARLITSYGFVSSPPVGSEWIIFNLRANSDDKMGIANPYGNRFKGPDSGGIKEGEAGIYNIKTGNYIFFNSESDTIEVCKKNKSITIDEDLNITAKNVTINASGNVTLNGGTVNISSNTTIDSKPFLTHTHQAGSYVDSLSGPVTGTSGIVT
jgi:phage gp45-like